MIGIYGDGGKDKGGKVAGDWLDTQIKTNFNRDANYLSDRGNPSWLVSVSAFYSVGSHNARICCTNFISQLSMRNLPTTLFKLFEL